MNTKISKDPRFEGKKELKRKQRPQGNTVKMDTNISTDPRIPL